MVEVRWRMRTGDASSDRIGRMRRLIEVMLVVAIALDIAYWTIWFSNRDWIASEHTTRTTSSRTPSRWPTSGSASPASSRS